MHLLEEFAAKMEALYGAPYWMAQNSYNRWNVSRLKSRANLEAFLQSRELRSTIFNQFNLNTIKCYSKSELSQLGLSLQTAAGGFREFVDSVYGCRWRQLAQGDVWLESYYVVAPVPSDAPAIQYILRVCGDSP